MKQVANQFWFVVGSQHLYGAEALKEVEKNAKEIAAGLNASDAIQTEIVFKGLGTSAEEIVNIVKEANYDDNCAGLITWMHTFSPAKMWIAGTKLLQKPLLHFATQYKAELPWNEIDMDYMNLHQSAHGDREYGFINARLKKHNKVIFGHWQQADVQAEINDWTDVARAYNASQTIKVARFGDNMRSVAVTDGDKIEAQIQFGWTVDYYGIGDLVAEMDAVSDAEIDATYAEYEKLYDLHVGDNDEATYVAHVREQARIEIALRRFLARGNYDAFTTNFEDLYGMKQLPGLAVQRLNAEGYGFAGEGDWKTAALDRMMKVMAHNESTGFMEDYTYDLTPENNVIVGSHMLEVDPTLAETKPKVMVLPLGIGGKEAPARLVFDGKAGEGITVSMVDLGTHYRLLVNDVECVTPTEAAPKLPVARVMWHPQPNQKDGVKAWIYAGGGHHTVLSLALNKEQIVDWARMMNLETVIIDKHTSIASMQQL
ncbi:L-arabinose isomerase [Kurthia massiliensis]|uniref:L-arabinose isomerase n=1 Tax=Kurthia massiliensis TaxID=1033739 RepID=UPI00028A0016|nr:L-arabinose isomerase [Kurthia massiliensis]